MTNRNHTFDVTYAFRKQAIIAKTPGAAARIAFRNLIRSGTIKKQPRSSEDGGWDGTSIVVRKSQ